jgi:hypothetical protein
MPVTYRLHFINAHLHSSINDPVFTAGLPDLTGIEIAATVIHGSTGL